MHKNLNWWLVVYACRVRHVCLLMHNFMDYQGDLHLAKPKKILFLNIFASGGLKMVLKIVDKFKN